MSRSPSSPWIWAQWHVTELLRRGQLSNASGRDRVVGVAILNPTAILGIGLPLHHLATKPHIWQCRYFHLFLQVTGMIWAVPNLSSYHVSATRTQRCPSHQRKPSGARFNRFRGTNGIRLSFQWCFIFSYSTKGWGCRAPMTNRWHRVSKRLGRCGSD